MKSMNRYLLLMYAVLYLSSCGNDNNPCVDFISREDVIVDYEYACNYEGGYSLSLFANPNLDYEVVQDLGLTYQWEVGGQQYEGRSVYIEESNGIEAILTIANPGCEISTTIQLDQSKKQGGILGSTVWFEPRFLTGNRNCFDASDDRIEGFKVDLIDPLEWVVLDQVFTDSFGYFVFVGLPPGDYVLRFNNEDSNMMFVQPNNCNNHSIDSDCDSQGYTEIITLGECEINLTYDAGLTESFSHSRHLLFG